MNIDLIVGNFLTPLVVAGIVSWITTKWVVKNAARWGIVDNPISHKHPKVVHEYPVPRGGGLPIFMALIVCAILFFPEGRKVWGILGGATMLVITGWIDDKFEEELSPYVRLVINVLAALAVIGTGIGIAYITNPAGGVIDLSSLQWCFWLGGRGHCIWWAADIFAIVWLVWMQNAVGWSSGVDGQLPGFVAVAAITMGLLGLRFGADNNQLLVITLSAVVAGAYIGFLPWNWWPQKIMPGYGGKSLAGFLLGVLAILSAAKVGALILVLGVPMIDAVLVMVKRIRAGKSPVWGGRDHLHHLLLDKGWSKRNIAMFYLGVSVLLAIAAWQLNPPAKFYTMAAVSLIIGGGIWWLHYWSTYSKQPDPGNGLKT